MSKLMKISIALGIIALIIFFAVFIIIHLNQATRNNVVLVITIISVITALTMIKSKGKKVA